MSAFVVSAETLNRAVTLFDRNSSKSCEQLDEFGQRLWDMNAQAVAARYPDRAQESPGPFKYALRHCKPVVALKALHCLIYQCSEGDVPELALYHQLRDRERHVMREIVDELPEYQNAAWND